MATTNKENKQDPDIIIAVRESNDEQDVAIRTETKLVKDHTVAIHKEGNPHTSKGKANVGSEILIQERRNIKRKFRRQSQKFGKRVTKIDFGSAFNRTLKPPDVKHNQATEQQEMTDESYSESKKRGSEKHTDVLNMDLKEVTNNHPIM